MDGASERHLTVEHSIPPRRLDRVRERIRRLGLARWTEDSHAAWVRSFILANGKRHPETLGASEVDAFLMMLATRDPVAASTQNQPSDYLGTSKVFAETTGTCLQPVSRPGSFGRFVAPPARSRTHRVGAYHPWILRMKTRILPLRLRRQAVRGSRSRAAGFSIIEVLIALLVLAFGLLGFALMQALNLRYTQSANTRTQATNLAFDMFDQMRSNRLTMLQYTNATFARGAVSDAGCTRIVAASVTVADNIARWQCQVVAALGPQAAATVNYAPGSGMANITLTWGERLAADPNTTFLTATQL